MDEKWFMVEYCTANITNVRECTIYNEFMEYLLLDYSVSEQRNNRDNKLKPTNYINISYNLES